MEGSVKVLYHHYNKLICSISNLVSAVRNLYLEEKSFFLQFCVFDDGISIRRLLIEK